ncbi:hypothetical protein SIN8267_01675 [Sinobacterium norvegicum]|uniref:Uncharacterized protein n=1 Tax=Sinobacterium norvegicum TaxID=1641715 RepID=A0ABM9AEP7_9GAMM|nr:hypothetical protein [Sinobacterium norvegicum]CAH0991566.1 hypothetical protein SIN8267_01675 [Sinobacterium norvegicum]
MNKIEVGQIWADSTGEWHTVRSIREKGFNAVDSRGESFFYTMDGHLINLKTIEFGGDQHTLRQRVR